MGSSTVGSCGDVTISSLVSAPTIDPKTFNPFLPEKACGCQTDIGDDDSHSSTEETLERKTIASCKYAGGTFELTDRGVFYEGPPDEQGTSKPATFICSPLRILANTRTNQSVDWGCLLEWEDKDRIPHQWAMPYELLQRDGGVEMRSELARQGLVIAPGRAAREFLMNYLQVWPIRARARCVDRLGWQDNVFVLPAEVIGRTAETVVFQNVHAVEPAFSTQGTVSDWRDNVGRLIQGNGRLVFAASAALTGALLEPSGEDPGGFHFRGSSSTGKTSALRTAASIWGSSSYCRNWRTTANGLEGLAALHNDGLLILDELGQIDPREAGESAYLLANGRGKSRATRTGAARQAASWRLLFLSAGEQSLAALMAQVGKKTSAGQEIRIAEIEADAGAGMGIVEELHGCVSSAALIQKLRSATSRYYGAVGAEWLRRLVAEREKLPQVLADGIREFVAEAMPKGASGQVERVARRFGLVAVAGEMATRWELTGWPQGEAGKATRACFDSWLSGFGTGDRDDRTLLAQVKKFFEQHGASRFENADGSSEPQRTFNRAGFYRVDSQDNREFLVLTETFRTEVCAGFDPKSAAKVLQRHGWLLSGSDRITQKVRLPGMGPTWVYAFNAKVWEGGAE